MTIFENHSRKKNTLFYVLIFPKIKAKPIFVKSIFRH